MSWLSDFLEHLKPSCRWEHFMAKIAGEEELENEYIPSSREEGFWYKIAQRLSGSVPAASEDATPGMVPTVGTDGEAVYDTPALIVNIVPQSAGTGTVDILDKTANEIIEALNTRGVVVHWDSADFGITPSMRQSTTVVSAAYTYTGANVASFTITVILPSYSPMSFYAASGSDHPAFAH